jgi:transketolase
MALDAETPVYLRMGKADLGDVHSSSLQLNWGDLCRVKSGAGKIAFLATGSMVKTALNVSEEWNGCSVWSVPFIKPINEEQVISICRNNDVVVTLEEHSVHGGLGAVVAEVSSTHEPTWICRVGIRDRFSQYCGSYNYLMKEHCIDVDSIKSQVNQFLANIKSENRVVYSNTE